MIVFGAYRVVSERSATLRLKYQVNAFSTSPDATIRNKACFWILQITFEFSALSCYLAVSISTIFSGHSYKASEDISMPVKHNATLSGVARV